MKNSGHRILAHGQFRSNDTWETGLNNNDAIIGPSGCGKTRGYAKPNILQMNGSMVVTDTKGALYHELGPTLERHGYRVMEINLADPMASDWGYNPLLHVRYDKHRGCYDEQDILTLSTALVPIENSDEPFWDLAAKMMLEGMVAYTLEFLPYLEHNLCTVGTLLAEMPSGRYDRLLQETCEIAPDGFTAMRYKMTQICHKADKMYSSIQGVLAEKISPFSFDGAKSLFHNPRQISFRTLAEEKTAIFLTISDTDPTNYRLANLFYTQALHLLCHIADHSPGHRLAMPVHFYLDDFASNACIPDFDRIISVIRSREISVSIIFQSLSQLESLYGHARALTILNNCDNMLYLGGQDVETARFVGRKANKPTSVILQMPLDSAWLFTRGAAPQQVKKYRLENHPRYQELPEWPTAHRAGAMPEQDHGEDVAAEPGSAA